MTIDDLVETRKVLESYGATIVSEMKDTLLQAGKSSTGQLVNSISYTITHDGSNFSLEFPMEDYGYYVDKGRKPGKMPPVQSIESWLKVKGLPVQAAFPIARKIGKEGIKPAPFYDVSVEKYRKQLVADVSSATAVDIQNYIAKQLTR